MTLTPLNISKILVVAFAALLLLAIPQLNMSSYVLPTITSKTIYFLYGGMFLLGLYSMVFVFSRKTTFKFSKIDLALLLLVLYISLNRYCIQENHGFSIRYIELIGICFFYLILRTIALKNYVWLLLALVISGIIQAVYGNLQLLGYYDSNHSAFKMTGSFFNPGPYAGFLVSVWAVALGMYLFKERLIAQVQTKNKNLTPTSPKERGAFAYKTTYFNQFINYIFEYIPLLGLISIAIVLPALQSRASWMAAIISSAILLELRYHFLNKGFKKVTAKFQKIALIIITIGVLSAGLFSLYQYKKASSDGRAFIWKITAEIIVDNPVFGVGFDRFKTHYMNYQADYFAKNSQTAAALVADNVYYAFNEVLQFVAENGLLGCIFLLLLVFVLLQTKTKTQPQTAIIAKTGLLTVGVFAFFSYPMQILPIKLVLVLLLAMLSSGSTAVFGLTVTQNTTKAMVYKTSFVLLTCLIIYQTFGYTTKLKQGFINWNNALNNHQFTDYDAAIIDYKTAYPLFKNDGDFLMNYGKTLTLANKPQQAIALLKQAQQHQNNTVIATALGNAYSANKQYTKAEACYKQAQNMALSKFYAPYLLAKLYDDFGYAKKATTLAQKLLNKKIKIPSTAIEEIQLEMKKIILKHKKSSGVLK